MYLNDEDTIILELVLKSFTVEDSSKVLTHENWDVRNEIREELAKKVERIRKKLTRHLYD